MNFQQNNQAQTMSLGEIFDCATHGAKKQKQEANKEASKIKIEIEPETFESDYKTKMISTSEICELLTERLGEVFKDYVGCRDISYVNSPELGVLLVFDPNLSIHRDNSSKDDNRLVALEKVGEFGKSGDNTELQMIETFNGYSRIKNSTKNGGISEESMGFRLTNEAIEVLLDNLVDFDLKDGKEHKNFRSSFVSYGMSADGTHNQLILTGVTLHNAVKFIFGDKDFDYTITPGAPINNANFSGHLVEVRQIKKSTTKKLISKYVNRQVVSDGLFRPIGK